MSDIVRSWLIEGSNTLRFERVVRYSLSNNNHDLEQVWNKYGQRNNHKYWQNRCLECRYNLEIGLVCSLVTLAIYFWISIKSTQSLLKSYPKGPLKKSVVTCLGLMRPGNLNKHRHPVPDQVQPPLKLQLTILFCTRISSLPLPLLLPPVRFPEEIIPWYIFIIQAQSPSLSQSKVKV